MDWTSYDRVLISSTWDYHTRLEEFSAWLGELSDAEVRVDNDPDLMTWNLDKRYLRELESARVPTIPTIWGPSERAATDVAERGWEQVIVKPAVDLGAMNLVRTDAAGVSAAIADMNGAFLVQPYLPSLERDGELSVVGLGGEVTYTLRKRPADGDFRVQPQYGGEHAGVSAPAGVLGVAASAMAVVRRRGDPLYWRVDMVRGLDGDWRCIEVELIEPALFLDVGEGAADRLAELLVQ